MHINKITRQNFESKTKGLYVFKETQENAQTLLKMMSNDTKYVENSNHTVWNSDILTSLSLGKKIKFQDNRILGKPSDVDKKLISDCSINIGRNRLDINSSTGEILGFKKGWLTTWRGLLEKADNCLSTILINFDNSYMVTKNRFKIQGFTKKGLEALKKQR